MPFLGFNPNDSTTGASNTIADTTTIGDGTAEDVQIRFDGNTVDYHLGLDDSADKLTIGKGSALGTTTSLAFDADGIISKPLLPFVHAYNTANDNNLAHNTDHTVEMDADFFDQNADFNNTNDVFTAPVTGTYFLQTEQRTDNADKDNLYMAYAIVTSNRNYEHRMALSDAALTDDHQNVTSQTVACVADMDAGDTAYPAMYTRGSTDSAVASGAFNSGLKAFHMFGYLIG